MFPLDPNAPGAPAREPRPAPHGDALLPSRIGPTQLRKVDERAGKSRSATIPRSDESVWFARQKGITMFKEFECERDGVVIRGADDEDLVANVERHLAEAHPELVGKVSGDDIVAAASEGLTLRLKRVLSSPRAVVYRALTDPGQLPRWWGPRGFTAPSVEFVPRVGGSYRIAMQPPEGDRFHLLGAFLEVDPPARLAYTFRWDPPDPTDRETIVTLSLQEMDEGTAVLLNQGEFATGERLDLHEQGWTESFGRLEQLLGEPRD
jgi:uncharacterized protein YndB with AHSA1/START domain